MVYSRNPINSRPRGRAIALCVALIGWTAACAEDDKGSLTNGAVSGGDGGATSAGDAVRGGALYDSWASVKMATPPTSDHPLWAQRPDMMSNTLKGADTWRCKECHGWDYKGVQGAYGSGSHKTGFAGIATTKTSAEVVESLKTKHGYGAVGLSDVDLRDLAAFVKEGTIETTQIIDANKKFIGDHAKGATVFTSTCQLCHGPSGLNSVVPGFTGMFDEFPGKIASDNPWEFQHKVRFGQPGSAMPPQMRILSVAQVGDLGAHAQSLPKAP